MSYLLSDDKRESNERMLFTRYVSTETPYLVSLSSLCTISSYQLSYCKAGTFFLHNKHHLWVDYCRCQLSVVKMCVHFPGKTTNYCVIPSSNCVHQSSGRGDWSHAIHLMVSRKCWTNTKFTIIYPYHSPYKSSKHNMLLCLLYDTLNNAWFRLVDNITSSMMHDQPLLVMWSHCAIYCRPTQHWTPCMAIFLVYWK